MQADKESVVRLLRTARGQIDGILKMVEEDRYCIDVSNQLLATQSVLKKANREILHAHMNCCVKQAFEEGAGKEKIDEILCLLDKIVK
ncbi:MAG: metal-sensing transcriptional repressor [Clostridiales bacterium]|jgi:DNA-binding FrmR family transcriptional regulator|nr:metal-sensing transcriptional repressor [Clostridiales bacterium]